MVLAPLLSSANLHGWGACWLSDEQKPEPQIPVRRGKHDRGPRYIPAVFVPYWNVLYGKKHLLEFPNGSGRMLPSWHRQALYPYRDMLFSAHPCLTNKKQINPRLDWEIPSRIRTFADSGGFQAATLGWKADPVEILRWQERNADIAFTFDVPSWTRRLSVATAMNRGYDVGGTSGTARVGDDFETFKAKCDASYKHNETYAKHRKNPNCMIYLVVQGATERRITHWYNRMHEFHDTFEGVALGGLVGSAPPQFVAHVLAVAYHLGIRKNLHILGIASTFGMAVMAYAGRYFDNITYDASSSLIQGMKFRLYCIPGLMHSDTIQFGSKRAAEGGAQTLPSLPCVCSICRVVPPDYWNTSSDTRASTLLGLHNLFVYEQKNQIYASFRNDPAQLKELLRRAGDLKSLLAIEYLDYAIKHSPEAANKLYGGIMTDNKPPLTSQPLVAIEAGEAAGGYKKKKSAAAKN